MGHLSFQAANGIIWPTYAVVLISACALAYWKRDSKSFLSANRTQKAIPLAFNFVASGLGVGILSTFPQIANFNGLQGLLVYALASGLPMFLFAFFGPHIRKKVPNGFVLTEWVFYRYGRVCGLYMSACTILTLFLFTVSEIASLKFCIETLTSVKALPVIIIECVVTTIYTSIGGFNISFLTDTAQVSIVFALLIIVASAMGSYITIDTSKIAPSGLLKGNKLGYQLIYILVVAIFTNDFFMSGFWLRTFAARNDKDLLIGCSIAFFIITIILVVVGVTGFIAVWAGLVEVNDPEYGSSCFFVLLAQMPSWVMGFVLVFVAILSTCTLDSLQSALVSSISNDIFRNKLPLLYVRVMVAVVMIPIVVVGLKATDVLSIYLIVDLLSSTVVPVLMLGLSDRFHFMTGWEVIGGGLGGILSVWIFGTVYYDSPKEGGKLLLISNGLYSNDWSAFGAFVVGPFGGILFGFIVLATRCAIRYFICRSNDLEFDVFKPISPPESTQEESGSLRKSTSKTSYTNRTVELTETASEGRSRNA
ncbi:LANO_0C05336g1_1 [Lachancea nothofagi CBS 11611]|uniref:LANO_0C05336g1_1 n=1 Tax=Lachancea nothofagi CBS 11611 TaxID=1266666 RepID=A0A1G4J7P0_9SACH|nr:LANO_0C05336g1_1 [Lachancea nothofagi CBS 11611]